MKARVIYRGEEWKLTIPISKELFTAEKEITPFRNVKIQKDKKIKVVRFHELKLMSLSAEERLAEFETQCQGN